MMVRVSGEQISGRESAKELDGATICTEGGTTTEMNMADYFHANNMKYTPVVFDNSDQTVKVLNLVVVTY